MLLLLQVILGSVGISFVLAVGVWLGMQVRELVALPVIAPAPDYLQSHLDMLTKIQLLVTKLSEPVDLKNAATAIQQALRDVSQIVQTMNTRINKAIPLPPPTFKTAASAEQVTSLRPTNDDDHPIAFDSPDQTSSLRGRKTRRKYERVQYMAICREGRAPTPDSFIAIECRDIGTDGMAFVCPAVLDAPAVIISLGDEPSLFFMLCEVIGCARIDEVTYHVDCRFVKRIDGDILRWNPDRRAIESSMADELNSGAVEAGASEARHS